MKGEIKTQEDSKLILSSVRALWGMITPSLRSVSVEIKDNTLLWQCIFDKGAKQIDLELMSEASGEVMADFNLNSLTEKIIEIPYPEKIENLKNLIYFRHEK